MKNKTLPNHFFPEQDHGKDSCANSDFVGVTEVSSFEEGQSLVPSRPANPLLRMSPRALLFASIGIFVVLVTGALAITRLAAPPPQAFDAGTIVQSAGTRAELSSIAAPPKPTGGESRPEKAAAREEIAARSAIRVKTSALPKQGGTKALPSAGSKAQRAQKNPTKVPAQKPSPKPLAPRGNFNA